MSEFNPDAVWSELPRGVRAWIGDALTSGSHARGDWPEIVTVRRALIYLSALARVERLQRVEGLDWTTAVSRTAEGFGIEAATLRRYFYRVHTQVDEAVDRAV